MASASVLITRYLPFAIGVIYLIIHLRQGRTFNRNFLLLTSLWLMINLLVMFVFVPFTFVRLIVNTMNLLFVPYLMLKEIGMDFWKRFENIIFALTLISLPLFLLNNLFPSFFYSLWPGFQPISTPSLTADGVFKEFWTALVYTHAYSQSGVGNILRNSGFMWEPGGFALMIIWGIVYNWLSKGMSFNLRIIVYIIAILTTFSTAGYPALFVLLLAYYSKRLYIINIVSIILLMIVSLYVFRESAFLSGELSVYVETFEADRTGEAGSTGKKVNRFQGGVASLLRTMKYPLGYGLSSVSDRQDKDFSYGVNGLASLLEMWGVLGFIILMISMYRSFYLINQKVESKRVVILLFIALMIMFFSNPIARNIFTYFIIISPLIFKKANTINDNF